MSGVFYVSREIIRAHYVWRFVASPQEFYLVLHYCFQDIEPSCQFGVVRGFRQEVQFEYGLAVGYHDHFVWMGVYDPFVEG